MSAAYYQKPVPLADAFLILDALHERYPPHAKTIRVNSNLIGRILAEDIEAEHDVPAVRASRENGFATMVAFSGARRVVGSSTALSPYNAALLPGECVRISIGGVVPQGADTVVSTDDVALTSQEENSVETVEFVCDLLEGEFIREKGSDARRGEQILPDGFRMDSVAIGMLSELGITQVEVYMRARVCVLSIGDEYNAERPMDFSRPNIQALFHAQGFKAIDAGAARGLFDEINQKLLRAAEFSCAIVTFGGLKIMREVARRHGLRTVVNSVESIPGNFCFAHGNIEGRPVFLGMLPEDLDSAWIGANLFMSPMLRAMGGRSSKSPPCYRAKSAVPVAASPITKFLRARTERVNGVMVTAPLAPEMILGANSIIEIPPNTDIEAGGAVNILLIEFPAFVF